MEGSEFLCGIPYDSCPGDTFADKRRYILTLPVDDLKSLVNETHGFVITMKSGCEVVYVIPSGFVLAMACTTDAKCLRWGVSGGDDADTARVHKMATEMLQSFPELRSSAKSFPLFLGYLSEQSAV